jgi:hypothetical protein
VPVRRGWVRRGAPGHAHGCEWWGSGAEARCSCHPRRIRMRCLSAALPMRQHHAAAAAAALFEKAKGKAVLHSYCSRTRERSAALPRRRAVAAEPACCRLRCRGAALAALKHTAAARHGRRRRGGNSCSAAAAQAALPLRPRLPPVSGCRRRLRPAWAQRRPQGLHSSFTRHPPVRTCSLLLVSPGAGPGSMFCLSTEHGSRRELR